MKQALLALTIQVLFQLSLAAQGVLIHEFVFNHTSADIYEYVEIFGSPTTNYSQHMLLAIEGDAGVTGTVDGVFVLGTTDEHGLWSTGFLDNKLENGTLTLLLVKNFTGSTGDDLDADDNGVLDLTPWETQVDGVAVHDGDSNDLTYTQIVLTKEYDGFLTPVGGASRIPNSNDTDAVAGWVRNDFEGEGLPFDSATARSGEAINTPGLLNKVKEGIPEPALITIAEARSLPEGSQAKVQGILTVAGQLGGPAYIQDETGGIAIYDKGIHGSGLYAIGDQLLITAEITTYNSQKQLGNIDPAHIEVVIPSTISIEPAAIALADLETYEGQLVKISNVNFPDSGQVIFPNTNMVISDESGSGDLRIDGEVTGITFRKQPATCEEIVGVVGRFNTTFQLLPRMAEDIVCLKGYMPADEVWESKATTLEVVTWNMEFFGAAQAGFGPENEEAQFLGALQVIRALDADLYAVQEVSNGSLLKRLVDSLSHYGLLCSDFYSYYFNPDPDFPAQKLCFIYNQRTIKPVGNSALFAALYEKARTGATKLLNDYPTGHPASFWSSGRLPFMLVADVEQRGRTERVYFINVHAKSGAGDDDANRRAYDVQALKDSLDAYYSDKHVMVLGDFNDDVDVSITRNRNSPYDIFVEDENYTFYTEGLSAAGLRSTYYYGDMIDHIVISDELYDHYLEKSENVHYEVYHEDYLATTSDHFPVSLRLSWQPELAVKREQMKEVTTEKRKDDEAYIYPLPARDYIKIYLSENIDDDISIQLYNLSGHQFELKKQFWEVQGDEIEVDLNACGVKRGVYVLSVSTQGKRYRNLRLMVE